MRLSRLYENNEQNHILQTWADAIKEQVPDIQISIADDRTLRVYSGRRGLEVRKESDNRVSLSGFRGVIGAWEAYKALAVAREYLAAPRQKDMLYKPPFPSDPSPDSVY